MSESICREIEQKKQREVLVKSCEVKFSLRIIAQTGVYSVRTTRYGEEVDVKKRQRRGVVRFSERGGTKKEEEGKKQE